MDSSRVRHMRTGRPVACTRRAQKGLDGDHDLPAEPSAQLRAFNTHLAVRHAQGPCDESEVLDHLGSAADMHDVSRVEPCRPGLCFQISVLYTLGAVGFFNDCSGLGEARLNVPALKPVMRQQVAALIDERGILLRRLQRVHHQGKGFVFNVDARESFLGGLHRLRGDEGHWVPDRPNAILGKNGLVVATPEEVAAQIDAGDVARGHDSADAGQVGRRADVQFADAGVGHRTSQDAAPKHARQRHVIAESGHTGGLLSGIGPCRRLPDERGDRVINNHLEFLCGNSFPVVSAGACPGAFRGSRFECRAVGQGFPLHQGRKYIRHYILASCEEAQRRVRP